MPNILIRCDGAHRAVFHALLSMHRREKIIIGTFLAGLLGMLVLFASLVWVLWRESIIAENAYEGNLATTLGERTERIIADVRDMLATFDKLPAQRCSPEHLDALQNAAVSKPYIRGIGFWRAAQRLCGVGFLPPAGIKPLRADRIYPNGVIAWWPSKQTEVGGVQLFLMRYGDHDVAIDPSLLLDLGPSRYTQAVLWVDKLRMAAMPPDAELPPPGEVPIGVTLKRSQGVIVSHYARDEILPIDIVASEPIENFWSRHASLLTLGGVLGLLLALGWTDIVFRFSRYQLRPATELRQALAAHRICVQYQPVVDLRTGVCVGAEALARWRRQDGGSTSPAAFIPVAEEAGLIQEITLTVMRTAIRDLARIRREARAVSINVNLSRDDLKNDRLGDALAEGLKAEQLEPRLIKLEITERALVNTDTARQLIHKFRDRGHQVAIDDFGTGYSSLSYLQSFELDVLKIDKSFVDAIGTGAA
ncbi:MAG: EAL domain-containing protein, partial [Pseudolabrys sp.]